MKKWISMLLAVLLLVTSIPFENSMVVSASAVQEWDYTEDDVNHGNGKNTPFQNF